MNLMNLPVPRKDELKMMAMRLNWWMKMKSQISQMSLAVH